jgi:hypothetical protein
VGRGRRGLLSRLLRRVQPGRSSRPRSQGALGNPSWSSGRRGLAGLSLRRLAGRAGLTAASLQRQRRHLRGPGGRPGNRRMVKGQQETERDHSHGPSGRRSPVIGRGHGLQQGSQHGPGTSQPGYGQRERSTLRQPLEQGLQRHSPSPPLPCPALFSRRPRLLPNHMTHSLLSRFTVGKARMSREANYSGCGALNPVRTPYGPAIR